MITLAPALLLAAPRVAMAPEANLSLVVTEVLLALLLLGAMFLMRKRILRILCACGAEVFLFLACKLFFGEDSVITFIMRWITAAVACIVTVTIVNRINWKNLRGKRDL